MRQCFYTLFAVFLLTPVFLVSAQTLPCGNIITPAGFYYADDPEVAEPVTNCVNPMNGDSSVSFSTSFSIAGQPITDASVITIPTPATADDVMFTMNKDSFASPLQIFRRDGQDYHLVYDIRGNDYAFPPVSFTSGKYTAVFVYTSPPIFNLQPTLLERIFATLVPTAEAYYQNYAEVQVVNFEIVTAPAEPTGASSVLFLPGIMGSRLYENSTDCGGSGEQERWFSTSNCNQLRLLTDYTGKSINSIYTKEGESSVVAVSRVGVGPLAIEFPLYRSFLSSLASWKLNGTIADYVAVPYDWRIRLDDLLKAKRDPNTGKITYDIANNFHDGYLYQTLVDLVAHSKSGKVTIVAHSNGGLLAKTLMATLQAQHDPLLDKIDNVILVAVPQVGTPDAVLGMLQGEDIGPVGLVVSQQTARQLMNTMPFAHHLLPNQSYFAGSGVSVSTPVIRFVNGTVTAPWVATYGETITNANTLHAFLSKTSGRKAPAWNDLLTPAVVDGYLFSYTDTIGQLMNSWVPASTTKVYEVAGIGQETVDGVVYDTGTVCATYLWFLCTSYKSSLSYIPHNTYDGDGTVVVPSALAMSILLPNVKRLWLNLDAYNRSGLLNSTTNRVHRDIFEVPDIISFVQNMLLTSTTATYTYISTSAPTITSGDRLTFTLHSPLDMTLKLESGAVVSSTTPMLEGANYRRFGEVQYISVPDTSSPKVLALTGLGTGSFTLDITQQHNGSITKNKTYTAIPSSTSTKVIIPITDGNSLTSLVLGVDYDGNGSLDVSYSTSSAVVTYSVLRSAINALKLTPLLKAVLLETLKIADGLYQKSITKISFKTAERITLQVLKQQVVTYGKLNLISANDQKAITNMIDVLLSK